MGGLNSIENTSNKAASSLYNSNPSQKSGKLNGITQSASGISKTAFGAVANVGNMVAKVAGTFGGKAGNKLAKKLNGTQKVEFTPKKPKDREISGLKGFYNRLGGQNEYKINQVDTLNTFECYFYFYPNEKGGDESFIGGLLDRCGMNNSTLKDQKFSYKTNDYVESAAPEKQYLDLGFFIQRLTIPNIVTKSDETIQTLMGDFPVNGNVLMPESHQLQMDIVNTKNPIGEVIFYPWMREVTLPKWSYGSQPYTTANIVVDMSEHSNIRYVFLNCRPTHIFTAQPSQETSNSFTRQVTLTFDYMFVSPGVGEDNFKSPDKSKDKDYTPAGKKKKGTLDKIAGAAEKLNKAGFAAANILKL